jgi:hypothetical protein
MFKKALVMMAAVAITLGCVSVASADIVCADSSYVIVTFTNPAKDRISISPNGNGDSFSATGITINVFLRNCQGAALAGVPAQEIVLFNSGLCICPGGNIADAATDVLGHTSFSGTIRGGGCVNSLDCFADGVFIPRRGVQLGVLRTNSWDALPSSPCFVDAGDTASFATRLGIPANYTICSDWNEDGFIDAGDVASFAGQLGAACQ